MDRSKLPNSSDNSQKTFDYFEFADDLQRLSTFAGLDDPFDNCQQLLQTLSERRALYRPELSQLHLLYTRALYRPELSQLHLLYTRALYRPELSQLHLLYTRALYQPELSQLHLL